MQISRIALFQNVRYGGTKAPPYGINLTAKHQFNIPIKVTFKLCKAHHNDAKHLITLNFAKGES